MIGDEEEDLAYPSESEVPPDAPGYARSPELGAPLGARKRRKKRNRKDAGR
jgi:hypothetical protein